MLGFAPLGGAPLGSPGGTFPPPTPPPPPVATPHAYWRVFITGVTGGYVGIYSLDFQDSSGNSLCTGGVPSASSQYAYYSANRAFPNGQSGTDKNWISNGESAGAWLAYHFQTPVAPYQVAMCGHGPCNDAPGQPTTTKIQYSDDGDDWIDAFEADEPSGGWNYGVNTIFVTPPPPAPSVSASKMGVYVVEGPIAYAQSVSKLAAYVVEGSSVPLFASKVGVYVVEGPPSAGARSLSQAMLGTF